jgi:ABC-2 type transport system permease protein
MILYSITFFTKSPKGLFFIFGTIAEFLSGDTIPIPLMPIVLKTICYVLPFRLVTDLPFRIYTGDILIEEALVSILIQIVWILIVLMVGMLLMNKSTKQVEIQGG